MRQIKEEAPPTDVPLGTRADIGSLFDSVRGIIRILKNLKADYTEAINYNAITEYTQGVKPIPANGRMIIWNNTNAIVGQPSHYLVYNFNGVILTFASEELM